MLGDPPQSIAADFSLRYCKHARGHGGGKFRQYATESAGMLQNSPVYAGIYIYIYMRKQDGRGSTSSATGTGF